MGMTDREKAIVMAYTGVTMLTGDKLGIFYKYIEKLLGHPVMTHELADQDIQDKITQKSKEDFIALCRDNSATEYDTNDLISRKAAIETLALNTDYQTPEGIKNDLINHPGKECDWLGGIDEAISIIKELSSVPAVPLNKLCEWLEGAEKEGLSCLECADLLRNKSFVTKWMEEQDATD